MTRSKKLVINSISSLLHQFITLVCGFILPRLFLSTFGSAINGLVSSITQFLGFIALCEMGVGAVVQSALYKPLEDKDIIEVSKIAISSERFFRKIAYILIAYTIALMVVYPYVTIDMFDYGFTMLLILVMSISTFAQYYFGMTYRLILSADQLGFIYFTISSIALILNTIVCIVLMQLGASIHMVKLVTSLIFLLQPISMSIVARRRYKIDRNIVLADEPIKQKWNGLAQHIAAVVLGNTDTVVLTLLSTLEDVSIYAVYNLVVTGIKQLLLSLTNGIQAMIGNMLARKEEEALGHTFDVFEWIMHTGVTVFFSITAFLIVPFVSVYTKGIDDANYIVPTFAYLITLAQAAYCLRLPYNIMVLAAGHYKQTQWSAIIEAMINVVVSVVTVFQYGLVGVAVGTLVAMLYRTVYLAWYLRENIIKRRFIHYIKHMLVNAISVVLFILVISFFHEWYTMSSQTYIAWFFLAVKVGITCIVLAIPVNLFCYHSITMDIARIVKKKAKWVIRRGV